VVAGRKVMPQTELVEEIATWGAAGFALIAALLCLFASKVSGETDPAAIPGD